MNKVTPWYLWRFPSLGVTQGAEPSDPNSPTPQMSLMLCSSLLSPHPTCAPHALKQCLGWSPTTSNLPWHGALTLLWDFAPVAPFKQREMKGEGREPAVAAGRSLFSSPKDFRKPQPLCPQGLAEPHFPHAKLPAPVFPGELCTVYIWRPKWACWRHLQSLEKPSKSLLKVLRISSKVYCRLTED